MASLSVTLSIGVSLFGPDFGWSFDVKMIDHLPSWISWQLITLRIQLSLTIRGLTFPVFHSHLWFHPFNIVIFVLTFLTTFTCSFSTWLSSPSFAFLSWSFSFSSESMESHLSSNSPSHSPLAAFARDWLEFWSFQTQPKFQAHAMLVVKESKYQRWNRQIQMVWTLVKAGTHSGCSWLSAI